MVFEIISESKLNKNDVIKAISNSTLQFLGELGVSKTSLWLIDWADETQKGILKVSNRSVEAIRASLALINKINDIDVIFHVLGVSGTIKKAKEKYY